MSTQDSPHRRGRYPYPELSELSLDPDASPASVLPAETLDQVDQPVAQRRSTGATLLPPPTPLVLGRFPVPPQQRVGGDQERLPPVASEQSAEGGEDRSIGRPIAHPCVQLSFEHQHLVAEHHDLNVLVRLRAPGRHDEAEEPTQPDVEKREGHGG